MAETFILSGRNHRWRLAEALTWRCSFEPRIPLHDAFEELRQLCLSGTVTGRGRPGDVFWHEIGSGQPSAPEPLPDLPDDDNNKIPAIHWINFDFVVDSEDQPTDKLTNSTIKLLEWSAVWFNQMELLTPWLIVKAKRGGAAEDQPKSPTPAAVEELLSEAAPGENLLPLSERLAEFIYEQHPRDGGKPKSKEELQQAVVVNGLLGFSGDDFDRAYRQVYESKNHRPQLSGWPLREPYRSRLDSEKIGH